MAAELQEVWEQAEYSTLHKENTQCITNVPDTHAVRLDFFQPKLRQVKFISTLIPIVSLYQMSKRKRVQWAVIGWLCKISNSLGNLCIKLTLAYCLECV